MKKGNPSMHSSPDLLCRAIQHAIKEQAAREALTDAQFKNFDLKVHTHYDISSMRLHMRIIWRDPCGSGQVRCVDQVVDDEIAKDLGLLSAEVNNIVDSISLRGELFFFRLAQHFPNHLEKVTCDGKGNLEIRFKNGRLLQGPESCIDNSEFLAQCGMIYDL